MKYLLVAALLVSGCDAVIAPDVVTAPVSSPVAVGTVAPPVPAPVPGISCPTDKPVGLVVRQTQGRTDIEWTPVGAVTRYLVWLAVDTAVPWPLIPGAPATAEGTRYEWYGADPSRTYAVRVQAACGGQLSEAVVFGGRSGPIVPPPVEPPKCTGQHGCHR